MDDPQQLQKNSKTDPDAISILRCKWRRCGENPVNPGVLKVEANEATFSRAQAVAVYSEKDYTI